jgi:DNA invertase Pin-like site-specific DNA recombinase
MILVVDTADRLARDVLIMLTICAQIKAAGCTLEYADGTQNRTTKEGRLLQTILGGIAEYQRDGIAERTKAGLAKKKANGQHLGRAPLGYQYIKETKQLIENPQELLAIKCIRGYKGYEMAISSQLIADTINKEFGPCRGKKWSPRTIRKLLNKEKSS